MLPLFTHVLLWKAFESHPDCFCRLMFFFVLDGPSYQSQLSSESWSGLDNKTGQSADPSFVTRLIVLHNSSANVYFRLHGCAEVAVPSFFRRMLDWAVGERVGITIPACIQLHSQLGTVRLARSWKVSNRSSDRCYLFPASLNISTDSIKVQSKMLFAKRYITSYIKQTRLLLWFQHPGRWVGSSFSDISWNDFQIPMMVRVSHSCDLWIHRQKWAAELLVENSACDCVNPKSRCTLSRIELGLVVRLHCTSPFSVYCDRDSPLLPFWRLWLGMQPISQFSHQLYISTTMHHDPAREIKVRFIHNTLMHALLEIQHQ